MQNENLIWYAAYGSNMSENRFHKYITGGQPQGAKNIYSGCRDKTLPIANKEYNLDRELYFAKSSENWQNGGVAFIDVSTGIGITTFGRIYLIKYDQFVDLLKQETNTQNNLDFNIDQVISERNYFINEKSWYGQIIYLGREDSFPIFTFTGPQNFKPYTKPSENYVKTIITGIREVSNYTKLTIFNYLSTKKGIQENYSAQEIHKLINEVI